MAAFEEKKNELAALGVSVFAASVDSVEKTQEVLDSGLSFPIGHGVSRELGDKLGAWWEERRDFIQPSEFVIDNEGLVLHSTYSASPIGRTDAGDVVSLLGFLEARKKARAEKKANAAKEAGA